MKTDSLQAFCLTVTSFLLLSVVINPTEGKCAGRWAIHACWGGNGKRSDPMLDEGRSRPNLLQRLLQREDSSPVFAPTLGGDLDIPLAEQGDLAPPPPPSYDDRLSDYELPSRSSSLQRLTTLLRMLRNFQKEEDALP